MQEMHQHEEMHAAEPARQPLVQFSRDSICVSRKILLTVGVLVGVFVLGMLVSSGINNAGKAKIATKSRANGLESSVNRLNNPLLNKYMKDEHFVLFANSNSDVAEGRFLALAHVDLEYDFKDPVFSCLYDSLSPNAGNIIYHNNDPKDDYHFQYYLTETRGIPGAGVSDDEYMGSTGIVNHFQRIKNLSDFTAYSGKCSDGFILFYQSLIKGNLYLINYTKPVRDQILKGEKAKYDVFKNYLDTQDSRLVGVRLIRIPFQEFAWSKMLNGSLEVVSEGELIENFGTGLEKYINQ